MNAIISATKKAEREAKKQQILSPKDLPTFSGQAHEDVNDFLDNLSHVRRCMTGMNC